MDHVTVKGRHGDAEVLTVRGLRRMLDELMAEVPGAAERAVFLGHDPEGNPPFHALESMSDPAEASIAYASIHGKQALVLWAGYPQAWDDDIAWGYDEEEG